MTAHLRCRSLPPPGRGRPRPALAWLLPALLAVLSACGTDPVAGLEGEFCAIDNDCSEGLVCERRVCLPLEVVAGDTPPRDALFFAALRLQFWDGAVGEGALDEFGEFVSDLSMALFPYYAVNAPDATLLEFGRADADSVPLVLSPDVTLTEMAMIQLGSSRYRASVSTLLMPVIYRDDNVSLDFMMPLMDAQIELTLPELAPDSSGDASLRGALRAVDAQNLIVKQAVVEDGEVVVCDSRADCSDGAVCLDSVCFQEFSLFDVLRNDTMTVDTSGDGVSDAWEMAWSGAARLY